MKPACLILVILVFFSSCQQPNDIPSNVLWNKTLSDTTVAYLIKQKGKGNDKGKLVVRFYGWYKEGSIVADSVPKKEFENIFSSLSYECTQLQDLPQQSFGFIKINIASYLVNKFRNAKHYSVYFSSEAELIKDSALLAEMHLFKQIKVITKEKAKEAWQEENNPDWTAILNENPLPVSIDLYLKDEFFTKKGMDSVQQVMKNRFPYASEIQSFASTIFPATDRINGEPVFKFIVF